MLVDSAGKSGAEADAAFPPTSIEVRLYAGLLAAHAGDRTGVQAALEATRDSPILRDYPTVAQLQQVLLAEQSRLNGKPQAAVAQLPIWHARVSKHSHAIAVLVGGFPGDWQVELAQLDTEFGHDHIEDILAVADDLAILDEFERRKGCLGADGDHTFAPDFF